MREQSVGFVKNLVGLILAGVGGAMIGMSPFNSRFTLMLFLIGAALFCLGAWFVITGFFWQE